MKLIDIMLQGDMIIMILYHIWFSDQKLIFRSRGSRLIRCKEIGND
jgi:hypothetical protein